MIKGKIFEKCKKYFEEYLFGFDQNHLKTSILTGKIHLHNVNIRPDKVNEIFAKKNMPIALKAGLISELSIKVNLFQLFSESLKIVVEDILFIIGPNISHMSSEQDFDNDINAAYDDSNPLTNLMKMHQKVYDQWKTQKEEDRAKKREEAKKKADKAKQKAQDKNKKAKELKEPPMQMIANLLGGLKLEIKRVHFRYEDDYFQHHRPFAFGLMVESIIMDNADTDWVFDSLMTMNFMRHQPTNPKTTNKELNIKNVKVYWNSMSEMFVPTSLWQQTRHLEYQIFEAMDANFLRQIMVDAFSDNQKLPYNYLIQPFTIYTSINLNPSQGANDLYKYQINTLISSINVLLQPTLVRDILKFQQFLEMFSYAKDLKKYRPLIRVQTFVEQQAYTPQQKKKRAAVIKDWWQLILWYIRLRKIAKGSVPYKLLEVEQQYQNQNLQNAIMKAKRANLMAYEHYQGSSDEEDAFSDPSKINSARTEDLDALQQYEKQKFDIHNTQVLRDMLTGFKFSLRLEGIKAKLFGNKKMVRAHVPLPRVEFCLDLLAVSANIQGANLLAKVLLKEIRLVDYFKREPLKVFSRQTNNASRPNLRDGSYSRSQVQADGKSGLGGMLQRVMSGGNTNAYNTPDKGKKLADIIYGNNIERNAAASRAIPFDFFSSDLPDPSQAHHKTRETLAISDILNNSNQNSRPTSSQQYGAVPGRSAIKNQSVLQSNDPYLMTTPSRASKVVKAQKFQQSPTKGAQERTAVMNNFLLQQRSEQFVDDTLDAVEKRCFLLLCGKQNMDAFLSVDVSANIFDEPGLKKKINLSVGLDHFVIEYCNDVLKSITDLGINYKLAFNFSDMKPALKANKLNKKRSLQTSLQYYTPLYTLKRQLLRKAFSVKEEAVKAYQKKWYEDKEKAKSKTDIMREQREKQVQTIIKIKDLDKKLSDINFDVGITLKNIYLGITGDKEDPLVANQTLLEFGIENQAIYLNKQDFRCKTSVFGISVTTLNSYEMLFVFANNMKKVVATYGENIAVLTSINAYKDFIKNIKLSQEKENQLKAFENQKELNKKASQPMIIITADQHNQANNKPGAPQRQVGSNFANSMMNRDNDGANLRGFPQSNQVNVLNESGSSQSFQAEKNMMARQGNNQVPLPQGRMGNNQIFLMNQNTIQSNDRNVKQNPMILDQEMGNGKYNKQQTGYNRNFNPNELNDSNSNQSDDSYSQQQQHQQQQQQQFRQQQYQNNKQSSYNPQTRGGPDDNTTNGGFNRTGGGMNRLNTNQTQQQTYQQQQQYQHNIERDSGDDEEGSQNGSDHFNRGGPTGPGGMRTRGQVQVNYNQDQFRR